MAFGFESGITSFYVRRESFFKGINIHGSFLERIQDLKSKMNVQSNHKPLIVILGAGPAGLFRAIQSICNGNPTTVIERRAEDAPGRINTVALTETTIGMLKYCGIYQYLLENELIDPPNSSGYTFANVWIDYSVCLANLIAIIQWFSGGPYLYTGCHRSLESFEVIKIGADRANEYCKSIGKTIVLSTGDASATVDPTTGLGCNTAIQSSVDFLDFIWDYDAKISPKQLLKDYAERTDDRVEYIHEKSKLARSLYRPDSLVPQSMFMSMA